MLFHRELSDNLNVCTNCATHGPIRPRERSSRCCSTAASSRKIEGCPEPLADPLHFGDQKRYHRQSLRTDAETTGEAEAIARGRMAKMGRTRVVAAARTSPSWPGRWALYVGSHQFAGGRARIEAEAGALSPTSRPRAARGCKQEGISLAMQSGAPVAVDMVKEAGLPYIVVITHQTTGGP